MQFQNYIKQILLSIFGNVNNFKTPKHGMRNVCSTPEIRLHVGYLQRNKRNNNDKNAVNT